MKDIQKLRKILSITMTVLMLLSCFEPFAGLDSGAVYAETDNSGSEAADQAGTYGSPEFALSAGKYGGSQAFLQTAQSSTPQVSDQNQDGTSDEPARDDSSDDGKAGSDSGKESSKKSIDPVEAASDEPSVIEGESAVDISGSKGGNAADSASGSKGGSAADNDTQAGADKEEQLEYRDIDVVISEDAYTELQQTGEYAGTALPTSTFTYLERFWKSHTGEEIGLPTEEELEDRARRDVPVKVAVKALAPEGVTAQVTYTEFADTDKEPNDTEKGLFGLEIALVDKNGNIYVPDKDQPVEVTVSGGLVKKELKKDNSVIVYAYAENEDRAEEYTKEYRSVLESTGEEEFYAADVLVYKDEDFDDARALYEPYSTKKSYKDGEDAVKYVEDKDGLSIKDSAATFMYDYSVLLGAPGREENQEEASTIKVLFASQQPDDIEKQQEEKDASTDAEQQKEDASTEKEVDKEAKEAEKPADKEASKEKNVKGGKLTAGDGKTYKVTVEYDASAGIPEDAELAVKELTEKNCDDYALYLEGAAKKIDKDTDKITSMYALDISFVDPDTGEEYHPEGEVKVTIRLLDDPVTKGETLDVVHFADVPETEKPDELRQFGFGAADIKTDIMADTAEVMDSTVKGKNIQFSTDGFSIFVVVKTVKEQTLTASDGKRYKVTVSYYDDAGIPEDAELMVSEIRKKDAAYDDYINKTAETLGEEVEHLQFTRPFDISLVNKKTGEKFQPDEAVKVSIELLNEDLDSYTNIDVVHIHDGAGKNAEIMNSTVNGDTVEFGTDGFSIYVITGVYRYTYRFFVPTDHTQSVYEEYKLYTDYEDTTFTQIIKEGEKLVVPELPTLKGTGGLSSNQTFAGWFVEAGTPSTDTTHPGTLKDKAFDFDNDVPETFSENKEIHLYARFAQFAYVIFHEQYRGNSWPITQTRRGELVDGSTTIKIDDVKVSYDDSSDQQNNNQQNTAPAMAFRGWAKLTKEELGAKTSIPEDYPREAGPNVTISENIDLYPVFVHINWLTFISGPSGSGATYYAPKFYYNDESVADFSDYKPVRKGYTFAGWYADQGFTKQLCDANGALTTSTDLSNVDGLSWDNGKLVLSNNVSIYAKWNSGDAKYTVVIWRQKISDSVSVEHTPVDYNTWYASWYANWSAGKTDEEIKNQLQAAKTAAENQNGYNSANIKTYDFAELFEVDAHSGDTVSVADTYKTRSGDLYTGFYYSASDPSATVSGDNSTVLNVYYDRYKMVYQFNRRNQYYNQYYWSRFSEMTGLYGQALSDWAYTWPSDYAWYDNYSGYNVDGTGITFLGAFNVLDYPRESYDSTTHTYTTQFYSTGNAGNNNIIHVLQGLNGSYSLSDDPSLVVRTKSSAGTFNLTNKFEGFKVCGYTNANTFTPTPQTQAQDGGRVQNVNSTLYVYHSRNKYDLTFVDSIDQTTPLSKTKVYYGESLSNYQPTETPTSSRTGYEFSGWYSDYGVGGAPGSKRFDFSDKMPMANVIVYACWATQWYLIKIDPNGGALAEYNNQGDLQELGNYSTWFWKQYGTTELITEYENTKRNFIESLNGTWYYAVKDRAYYGLSDEWESREDAIQDRKTYYTQDISDPAIVDLGTRYEPSEGSYRYANWYEVEYDDQGNETGEHLYNFSTQITHNMTLRLHWKQVGTYYLRYSAGEGTLDTVDNNEDVFRILDDADYADHSDIVVTRTAEAPQGYNFVGWQIRGGDGKVYYPGSSIEFQSKYAVNEVYTDEQGNEKEKKVLILDAVYTRVTTAKIIYDANGGTMGQNADAGFPIDDAGDPVSVPVPEITKDTADGKLTIANLVNNTGIKLSSGYGFTMEGATLKGWNTKPDCTGEHFDLEGDYYVDTEEPVTLYAEWEVKVHFHLNATQEQASFGGTWDSGKYTLSTDGLIYTTKVLVNNPVELPAYIPVRIDTNPNNLMFHYWSETQYTDPNAPAPDEYDFSAVVTSELDLFVYWAGPIQVPVHVVDASAATLAEKNDWKADPGYIEVGSTAGHTSVSLGTAVDCATYTSVPTTPEYQFAFAAINKSSADLQTLSEDNVIDRLYFNTSENKVYVSYLAAGKADEELASGWEVYFVYYEKWTPTISYKKMETDGSLVAANVSGNAPIGVSGNVLYPPNVTSISAAYDMTASVTAPLDWKNWPNNDNYIYYSYAIGDVGANADTDLHLVTEAKDSDNTRPNLRIRNTWRGFQYSTDDGNNWISYGYNPALYVVYFENRPTVVTLNQETFGLPSDMTLPFDYTIKVTETTTTTVKVETRTRTWNNGIFGFFSGWNDWSSWTTQSDNSNPVTTDISEVERQLSDGQLETTTLFYSPKTESIETTPEINEHTSDTQTQTRTTTAVTKSQTITITQTPKNDFTVDHSGTGTSHTSTTVYTYTTSATSTDQSVTYTNKRTPLEVEVHVATVEGDKFLRKDNLRSTTKDDYTVSLFLDSVGGSNSRNLNESTLPNILQDTSGDYLFAGILYGTEAANDGDEINVLGSDLTSVSYGRLYPEDSTRANIYECLLNGNVAKPRGDSEIYYVFYKQPKIYYMQETINGNLHMLTNDDIKRNNSAVSLGGRTVTQGERLSVGNEPFLISQSGSGYRVPPDLDGIEFLSRQYRSLAVGPEGVTNTSGMDYNTLSKEIQLKLENNVLKYSTDGVDWNSFSGIPAVYAIYKEKGYELTISKTVEDPTEGTLGEEFAVEVSSPLITESTYAFSVFPAPGAGDPSPSITVAPADSTDPDNIVPGTIVFTIKNGQSFVIEGLQRGSYTVTETLPDSLKDNFTVSAKVGVTGQTGYAHTVTKTGAKAVLGLILLDNNKTAALTNRFDAICKIFDSAVGESGKEIPFLTLQAAVNYASQMANKIAVIEMLVDYTMPSTDSVSIPSGYNITMTTASKTEGTFHYTGSGDSATITRGFSGTSMFTVTEASLTTNKITIDGRQSVYKADANGGIIKVSGTDSSVTLNENTVLKNSTTSEEGGAVYMGAGAVLRMNDASIDDCVAEKGPEQANPIGGGAIYCGSGVCTDDYTVKIENSRINGHYTLIPAKPNASCGGGILMVDGTLSISNSYLFDCTVASTIAEAQTDADTYRHGGTIYCNSSKKTDGKTINLNNIVINGYYGKLQDDVLNARDGGGIYINQKEAMVEITDSTIEGCKTYNKGAGIYTKGALTVTNSTIQNCNGINTLNDYKQAIGGGIYQAENNKLTIRGSHILNNCSGRGGGIYTKGDIQLINTEVTGNYLLADKPLYAAGIFIDSSKRLTIGDGASEDNTRVAGNFTQQNGTNKSNLWLVEKDGKNHPTSVEVKSVLGDNCLIMVINPKVLMSKFGFSTEVKAGVEASDYEHSKFQADDGSLYGTYRSTTEKDSSGHYAIIWQGKFYFRITNTDGVMLGIGGLPAVYSSLPDAFSTFQSGTFEAYYEGTTDTTPKNIEILIPEYTMNEVCNVSGTRPVTLTTAPGYVADTDNDALFRFRDTDPSNRAANPKCHLKRGYIADDTSMFNASASNYTMKNVIVGGSDGNVTQSATNGVAIKITSGQMTIADGAVIQYLKGTKTNNTDGGGAIYITGGKLILDSESESNGPVIKYCEATKNGGAILITGSSASLKIMDGSINNNKANGFGGGAIRVENGANVTISGGSITNNSLTFSDKEKCGGAIGIKQGTVTIRGGTISGNYASGSGTGTGNAVQGGAIFVNNSADAILNIVGGTITGNHVEATNVSGLAYGGAINLKSGGIVNISGGEISGNYVLASTPANAKGSGIYLAEGARLNISGSPGFGGNDVSNEETGELKNTDGNRNAQLTNKFNGGASYTKERQDIFLAGYGNADAASIHVNGTLSGVNGGIWIWAEQNRHYKEDDQFAIVDTGVSPGKLSVFRNARTDDVTTESGSRTEPLYGVIDSDNSSHVIWGTISVSGSRKVILRKVDSTYGPLNGKTFNVYMGSSLTPYVVRNTETNTTETLDSTNLTSSDDGVFWVGTLPYGWYIIEETDAESKPVTYFYLAVTAKGVFGGPDTPGGIDERDDAITAAQQLYQAKN